MSLESSKKSRSAHIGVVTRDRNRFQAIESDDPSTFDLGLMEHKLERLKTKTDEFNGVHHTICAFGPEKVDLEEEQGVADQFEDNVEKTGSLLQRLIALKQATMGATDLDLDLRDLATARDTNPERDYSATLTRLTSSFQSLRTLVNRSTIQPDHPIRREVPRLQTWLSSLSTEEKAPPAITVAATAPAPSHRRFIQLPKIALPQFDGDIMKWATFWSQFGAAVHSNLDLSQANKLAYLRDAIRDPAINKLLYSGVEHDGLYDEVVTLLQRRFDKRRIIHSNYCQTLIDQTPVKTNRADLNQFADSLSHAISGLNNTGQYDIGSCITSLSVSRLPKALQVEWELHTKDQKNVPPVEDFLEFLRLRADALSVAGPPPATKPVGSKPERKSDQPQRHRAAVHSSSSGPVNTFRYECVLCSPEKHQLYLCPKFNSMGIHARIEHLKVNRLCFNCLAPGHKTADCRSLARCKTCTGKHHTMVHRDSTPAPQPTATSNTLSASKPPTIPAILMMTSQVLLKGPGGRQFVARALLDSGSSMTLISSRAAQNLRLPTTKTHVTFSGVQDTQVQSSNTIVTLSLSPIQAPQQPLEISAAVVKKVTCDLPLQGASGVPELSHLKDLQLADPTFHQPGRIDLLLGGDILSQIMLPESKPGPRDTPTAWKTIFGWAILGPFQPSSRQHPAVTSSVNHSTIVDSSDQLLSRFWEVEELPTDTVAFTPEEEEVQLHFSQTHMYIPSLCRYRVTLPRKTGLPPLGDSRQQALQRYHSNERAVLRKGTWNAFQAVIQEYIDLGHAQPVPVNSLSSSAEVYYLPMHSVYKESSTSTKLRVVFDASAKSSNGISLNQTLMVGPTLHPKLDTILLRFRSYPVAITGDIAKMYREVELSDQDRHLHRFLWRKNPSEPVSDFEMTRVTFGVAASPYLAVKALQQTASDHGHSHPRASCHVQSSFYVDDLLAGANSPEEALELQASLRQLLSKGGFNLCKWRSSSPWVTEHIDPDLREKLPVKDITDIHSSPHPKALGLEWDSEADTMSTALNLSTKFNPTKRGVIADIAKTFDVLGWISPCVIVMKMLYQELWEEELAWDDEIPRIYQTQHELWKNELPLLAAKRLPRCYFRVNTPYTSVQIHGFSDASEKAYSAVVYLRSTYTNHPPIVALIAAKTKVAPLKSLTIPRLELCGADLLSKLITNVRNALDVPVSSVTAWCDSTIVLAWLDGSPKRYRTFVGNRISSILKQVPPEAWFHVPTDHNPADCASRGMMPGELLDHSLWWEGPSWLATEPVQTPVQPSLVSVSTPELRVVTCNVSVPVPSEWMEGRFESYPKTLAVTAWCSRFVNNLLAIKNDRPKLALPHLTSDEIFRAEHLLFVQSQARSFTAEITQLHKGQCIPSNSKLSSVSPILGQGGLLRVGGRLSHANLSLSQKHPIILSSKAHITIQLFNYNHVSLGHCGPTLLLASTGTRLHVVGARLLARTVCRKCVTCRRAAPKTETQMMGQLPVQRVTPNPPFYITGVDYAGPFILKKGHTRKPVLVKSYVAIFVCFCSKATHIEVVSDLTTETFLAALKRFISRRGRPKEMHSDNGSNFVGAKNDLNQLYQLLRSASTESAITSYLLADRIQWHCIPERAPHFGGLWEAAVKAAKHHLKRVVGTQRLTYEELSTVMCQVESCLNSRPLTAIHSHATDGISVLTPGHFLIGRPPTAYPETVIKAEPSLLKRWTMCQAMVHHFWKRWSTEYLQQLQSLSKWKKASPNLQVGDVVVIRDDTPFLNHWPMAKVMKTYKGGDNLVRVVLLKTSTTTLKRPVTKLALLHREEPTPSPSSHETIASSGGEDVQAQPAEQGVSI